MTYKRAVEKLNNAGVAAAELEAALLFEKFAGVSRVSLPFMKNEDIDCAALDEALGRRENREPLQYILGEWEFFGLAYEVNESCLCPRPDTELTVETALRVLPKNGSFLELCTGSGCIAVSLCKTRCDLSGIATDKFEATAHIAKRNAERHGVTDRLSLITSDLFDEPDYIGERRFDAIISNPPYIPTRDIDALSAEVLREPRAALDGGIDGLDFYRHIVKNYKKHLAESGAFIFEIGCDQGDALKNIAESEDFTAEIYKDLENNDRVAVLIRKELK